MPKPRKEKTGSVEMVSLRLDRETSTYYRKRANEKGTSLSDFLRQSIVQGMISETALDIEQRMKSMLAEMEKLLDSANRAAVPESLILSTYTCESILSKIVEARSIQELYDAQDKARERIKREKDASHVQTS